MNNDKMPETIWAKPKYVSCGFGGYDTQELRCEPDELTTEYIRADGETITELQRQLAALKAFVRKMVVEDLWGYFDLHPENPCDIQEKAEELGIIILRPATQEDVDHGAPGIDEVGDEMYEFASWIDDPIHDRSVPIPTAAPIPQPSRAQIAREFSDLVYESWDKNCTGYDEIFGTMKKVLQQWEAAEVTPDAE